MSKTLNVMIGSTCSLPGDLQGNLNQINNLARQAAALDSDILLTPELSVCGYGSYPEILALAEIAGRGPIYRELASIAGLYKTTIIAGFVELCQDIRTISQYIVFPDGQFQVQRKHRVTPLEKPLESAGLLVKTPDDDIGQPLAVDISFVPFTVRQVRCLVVICADWGLAGLNEMLDKMRIEMVFLPVGAGGSREERISDAELQTAAGKEKYLRILDQAAYNNRDAIACLEKSRALAAVNMAGFDGRSLYHGGSGSITSAGGDIAALVPACPNFEQATVKSAFARLRFQ